MNYPTYHHAARKHQAACRLIVRQLKTGECKAEEKKFLLLTLYYLSGYVIECTLKFALYSLLGYSERDDVQKLSQEGITYESHIKRHRFERYAEIVSQKATFDLPMVKNRREARKELRDLYAQWDAEIRYSVKQTESEAVYLEFFDLSEKIFQAIDQNLRH